MLLWGSWERQSGEFRVAFRPGYTLLVYAIYVATSLSHAVIYSIDNLNRRNHRLWGQTRKGLMPELDPTCVDWTIYDVNLRHLTLPYPVSKFIDICMVAFTKKLFLMI